MALFALIWHGQYNTAGETGVHSEAPDMVASDALKLYAITLNRQPTSDELIKLEAHGEWVGALDGARALVRGNEAFAGYLAGQPFVDEVTEDTADRKWQPASAGKELYEPDAPALVTVTLTVLAPGDKGRVVEAILDLGGSIIDGAEGEGRSLLVEVDHVHLAELTESPWIIYIEEYEQPSLLNDRIRDLTGSRPLAVPGFVSAAGLTGKGQSIGLADSGLDKGTLEDIHPDLRDQPGGSPKVIMLKSWVGVENPADNIGHGTHMAATMVGSGAASGGKFAGLAPEASLFFQGIVDQKGQVLPPVNIADLFRPAYAIGARIHVNGWGRPGNRYGTVSAQVDSYIRNNPEFVAIFGAGNDGPKSDSLTLEANSKNALVVGASPNPRPGLNGGAQDLLTPTEFSSRGPAGDGRIKPDLLAPGEAVISAASGMLDGNLLEMPEYTLMEGTSMSAAVMGGLVAQLRQFLAGDMGQAAPSAALVKALLINSARTGDGGPGLQGFGVADLGRTVISLEAGTMNFEDHRSGLQVGQAATWQFELDNPTAPFKATLAWTDLAALPGARKSLVNDLDLTVVAPDGTVYYGNHFLSDPGPDSVNNVEQVYIPHPAPGLYTVSVTARTVLGAAAGSGLAQDFALAYGQPLEAKVVAEKPGFPDKVQFHDGTVINLADMEVKIIIDDQVGRNVESIKPGFRAYLAADGAYFVGRQWKTPLVEARETSRGLLLTGMGTAWAEGGYLCVPDAGQVRINGAPRADAVPLPPGGEISAWIDPQTQTIWRADITYIKMTGFFREINQEETAIRLLGVERWIKLSRDAVIMFEDKMVHTDPADMAFATGVPGENSSLLPGAGVRLVIGPSSGDIQTLIFERTVVFSRVEKVEQDRVFVDGNKEFRLFPGATIKRDFRDCAPADIRPGDHIAGLFLPDSNSIIALWAYSNVVYGVVNHFSAGDGTLYVNTADQGLRVIKLGPETEIYRWGSRADKKALTMGVWVRMVLAEGEEYPRQVDIAESLPVESGILAGYDHRDKKIVTDGGSEYFLGKLATITRSGYPISPEELRLGDVVEISAILGPLPAGRSLTGLQVRETGGDRPELNVSTVLLQSSYWIAGQTTGARLYLWESNQLAKRVDLTPEGRFALEYLPPKGRLPVVLVAVAGSGSVAGVNLDLRSGVEVVPALSDIDTHLAGAELRTMAGEGLIAGFPDGTFRPDCQVTRAEFAVFLARAFGWYGVAETDLPFMDQADIPPWARQSIAGAAARGIMAGYPDGSFRPGTTITREEQGAVLDRVMRELDITPWEEAEPPALADRDRISPWAAAGVDNVYRHGIMTGRGGDRFMPDVPSTRAETAVAVYRLLNLVRQQPK